MAATTSNPVSYRVSFVVGSSKFQAELTNFMASQRGCHNGPTSRRGSSHNEQTTLPIAPSLVYESTLYLNRMNPIVVVEWDVKKPTRNTLPMTNPCLLGDARVAMDYIGYDEPMSRVGRFRIVEGITVIQETCDHIMNFRRRLFAGGSSTKTKHQMESGLLLDVVVREGTAVLELLSSEFSNAADEVALFPCPGSWP